MLLLTVIYFWPQVGQGRALYWGDIGLYFTPMTQFLHDNLRAGRLPLWNPLVLCGAPYVGNPQSWPLYPFTSLLPAVSAPYFLSLTVAVHVWLAGLGTALFLRRSLAFGTGAALLGAITFMFSGWLVSKEQFPNMVQAAAYLPWVLWGLDRMLRSCRTGDAIIFGTILGLQLLAAHAQITLLTLYLAVAWGLFRIASNQSPVLGGGREVRGWVLSLLPKLGLAGAVAMGLAAGQVLPTLQLFHDGWRQDMSFRIVNRFYLPLNQSANWVLPSLHGQPYFGNFTARGNFWETCCYVGWLPFLAAVVGVVASWRRGGHAQVRFWTAALAVAYLMALGGGARHVHGLYWLAYKVLPGFHSFHDPARCLLWATFALAVLAAAGGQFLLARLRRPTPLAALALLLGFAELTGFGRTIYPLADPAMLFPPVPMVTALQGSPDFAAHQARFLAPDSERVWERFSGRRDYRQDVPGYQKLWADTLTPNLNMPYSLADAYGYEPVTRRDAQQVLGAVTAAFRPNAPPPERAQAAAWAGVVGVRAVITDRVRSPEASLLGLTPMLSDPSLPSLGRTVQLSRVYLSRNGRWQPRARLVSDFLEVPNRDTGLERMLAAMQRPDIHSLDLAKTVVVAGSVPFASAAAPAVTATVTADSPDQVVVSAVATRPSLLLLADTLHPGWWARVDGQPAPLLSADGCLRAVPLPQPGQHRVIFTYRPETFLLGLYLTLLTLSALIFAAVSGVVPKMGRNSPPR